MTKTAFAVGLLSLLASFAVASTKDVSQRILQSHQSAQSFQQWIQQLSQNGMPGTADYFDRLFKAFPELVRNAVPPKLTYQKGTFHLREGKSEVHFKYLEPGRFSVDGKEVVINPFEMPTQKMKKILENLGNKRKAHILFMPVAWAQSNGQPTRLGAAVLAIADFHYRQGSIQNGENHRKRSLEVVQGLESGKPKCFDEIADFEESALASGYQAAVMMCVPKLNQFQVGMLSDRQTVTLKMDRAGFSVDGGEGKGRYKVTPVDPLDRNGVASDAPVSESSSPAQREVTGGEFSPADGQSGVELMSLYTPLASLQARTLCERCAREVVMYEQAVRQLRQGAMDRAAPAGAKAME